MGIEEDDDVGKEVLVGGDSTVSTAIVISSANAGGIQKCDICIWLVHKEFQFCHVGWIELPKYPPHVSIRGDCFFWFRFFLMLLRKVLFFILFYFFLGKKGASFPNKQNCKFWCIFMLSYVLIHIYLTRIFGIYVGRIMFYTIMSYQCILIYTFFTFRIT